MICYPGRGQDRHESFAKSRHAPDGVSSLRHRRNDGDFARFARKREAAKQRDHFHEDKTIRAFLG
jgi:hypothetical protein